MLEVEKVVDGPELVEGAPEVVVLWRLYLPMRRSLCNCVGPFALLIHAQKQEKRKLFWKTPCVKSSAVAGSQRTESVKGPQQSN
jgi:hypothetical protein